jgi:hypothetical protein
MTRTKLPPKPREMFDPYVSDDVPARMPFPDLLRVHKTASTEIPVPKLNRYQRSWLLDVAMRGVDIAGLDESAWKTYREKVKSDAFQEKAFQHVSELADDEEEARLVGLITDWKQKNPDKKNKKDAVDATVEADSATRAALLRGYPRAGWHIASLAHSSVSTESN